eukprot:scaffold77824_cov56-Attheya_sp.AAC.3
MQELSARQALFLGLIPGLIVEQKNNHGLTQRRKLAVKNFVKVVNAEPMQVSNLLVSLLTGDEFAVHKHLLELMTADVKDDGTTILRWIPFHMVYVMQQVSMSCLVLPKPFRDCLSSIADLFGQFSAAKWEDGDAWEALFLIVLLIRCLTNSFDDEVVPLGSFIPGNGNVSVAYNRPLKESCDVFTTYVDAYIEGIPVASQEKQAHCAISIYYPPHARFEEYNVILAFWNAKGGSFLIRGAATRQSSTVNRWSSVSEAQLDSFFGVSANQWSAKKWKELQGEELTQSPLSSNRFLRNDPVEDVLPLLLLAESCLSESKTLEFI